MLFAVLCVKVCMCAHPMAYEKYNKIRCIYMHCVTVATWQVGKPVDCLVKGNGKTFPSGKYSKCEIIEEKAAVEKETNVILYIYLCGMNGGYVSTSAYTCTYSIVLV